MSWDFSQYTYDEALLTPLAAALWHGGDPVGEVDLKAMRIVDHADLLIWLDGATTPEQWKADIVALCEAGVRVMVELHTATMAAALLVRPAAGAIPAALAARIFAPTAFASAGNLNRIRKLRLAGGTLQVDLAA